MQISIALDAMGGDAQAIPNLQGAYGAIKDAISEGIDLKILLCGPEDKLRESIEEAASLEATKDLDFNIDLAKFKKFEDEGRLEFVNATQLVGMEESPSSAVRQKKDSSMAKAFHLVKESKAQAVISAGNSGAMMAYGISVWGRLPAVKRPAILCHYPTDKGVTSMLDVGANVDCNVMQLEQFALMGKLYTQTVFEIAEPKVALLNIGSEESKGNELVKSAHEALKKSMPKNYVGFIEGREILEGRVDVIVCDGFVGNVVLKTIEGVAKAVKSILKEEISRNLVWGFGAWLAKGGFKAMRNKLDYREYGAAPLVGLQGLGLIAHGSSDGKAIKSAIRVATQYVQQGLMERLSAAFAVDKTAVGE